MNYEVMSQEDLETMESQKDAPTVLEVMGDPRVLADAALSFFDLGSNYATIAGLTQTPVNQVAFKYWEWKLEDQVRGRMKRWADGNPLPEVGVTAAQKTAHIDLFGGAAAIGDLTRAHNATGIPLETQMVETLMNDVFQTLEAQFVSEYFNKDGSWGTDFTPPIKWDQDNHIAAREIQRLAKTIISNGGRRADLRLIMSLDTWTDFSTSKATLEAAGYGQFAGGAAGPVNLMEGSRSIGGIPIVVADALEDVGSFMMGKHALLLCAPSMSTPMSRSALTLFSLNSANVRGPSGVMPVMKRDSLNDRDLVQVRTGFKMVQQARTLGVRIKDAVT